MANYKKFITLFLIFSVHMLPFNSVWALTSVRDWSITNVTKQGASSVVNASKSVIINGQVINKTSTAVIKPTPSQVANVLKGGIAGVALSAAVSALVGAVDWVLDPANNQIKYKEGGMIGGKYIFLCTESINGCPSNSSMINPKPFDPLASFQWRDLCASQASSLGGTVHSNSNSGTCIVTVRGTNKFYGIGSRTIKGEEGQEKTLPLNTVAEKVISNADAGNVDAQVATGAAADEALANDPTTQSDVSNQLDTNAKTQTNEQATGDTTPKDPADPNAGDTIKLNFPVFCTWAPLVCEAAQTAINFPKTITEWYTSTKTAFTEAYDFAKTKVQEFSDIFKDEQQIDTELEFNDPTDDITDTSVSFASSCPPPIVLADFNFHGIPIHWELDFTAWCDSLSTYLKPIVISMASFSAVLILGGVRENG
ncbi:MAG: virulence factor TspB C-terminal domain-related protein [Acinetobacter junii]|nr:virulence factor TspB C-terminal domain-related protein [Acinetobacter junii]